MKKAPNKKLKQLIKEELDNTVKEISLNPLNWFKKDEPAPEETPAEEPEAEEPEAVEPDDGCEGRGQDVFALASKIFKAKSVKDLNVFEQFGVGPMSLLRSMARIIKDDPRRGASELGPFIEAGARFTKHGKELSFRYLGNSLSHALKRGERWQFGSGPCVDGGDLSTAISYAFGEAEKFEPSFAGVKPEKDVDHLLSRHEGKIKQAIKDILKEMRGE